LRISDPHSQCKPLQKVPQELMVAICHGRAKLPGFYQEDDLLVPVPDPGDGRGSFEAERIWSIRLVTLSEAKWNQGSTPVR
jgi:hypothetical protein